MNNTELKNILGSKHINSWVKIYKDSSEIQDYLFLLYNTRAETDKDIFSLFYLVMHDLPEKPKAHCGSDSYFIKYGRGYAKYCEKYDRSLKSASCAVCHEELYKARNIKAKATNIKLYGTEIAQQSDVVKNKVKETNLERYGCESHNSNQQIKDKKVQTYMERYGVENPRFIPEVKSQLDDLWVKQRYNTIISKLDSLYTPLFDYSDLMTRGEYDLLPFYCDACNDIFEHNHRLNRVKCTCQMFRKVSNGETDLLTFITESLPPEIEILTSVRDIIPPKEIDIYIPSLKLAFEYNGVYWHSHKNENMTKQYHQDKVLACKKQGINLIHIFEDEWMNQDKVDLIKERIKSKLQSSTRMYARKCSVHEISKVESNSFVEQHHIQGSTNASINIGLFYEKELVAVMTFSASRFDKNYQYELIRYCSKGTIVGGASKLLKYFEREYNPESLMTYADMNWSTGNLYEKIGFKEEGITEPGYFYYDPKTKQRISRQKCQKHKLVKQGYPESLTESDICCNILGYYKIYDSGNLKYSKRY